jgi:CheY-like chemotaxis protein
MRLLHLQSDLCPHLCSGLDREDVVSCSSVSGAVERLAAGGIDGIVLPWRSLIEVRKRPASEQLLFDVLPMLVLLEDFPAESVLGMSLRVIEQGGDDSLVGPHSEGDVVVERLKIARLRRQFENAPVCAGQMAGPQWSSGLSAEAPSSGARPYARGWTWHRRPLRVLLLDHDPEKAQRTAQWLADNTAAVATVGQLEDAENQLAAFQFDVVLVDWGLHDTRNGEVLQLVRNHAEELAFVLTSAAPNWNDAETALAAGAQDWVVESQGNGEELWRAILCSAARQQRRLLTARMSHYENQRPSESYAVPPQDRRQSTRYLLTKPLVVIPILPDQSPDREFRGEGLTCDVSESGLAFEVVGLDQLPGRYVLVGVEGEDGVVYYATAEVRNRQQQDGRLRIGACLVPADKDLLQPGNLLPMLQPSTYRFTTGLPAETLRRWVEIGVLRPFLADRQMLCPKCHALSTLRRTCVHCGSVHITKSQLIRHFKCAYVGPAQDFQQGEEFVCPKCQAHGLVADADFEYRQGSYRCLDCNWSETELEAIGFCLACHWRFALHQAWEEELIGYHVNRLEPMALVNAT